MTREETQKLLAVIAAAYPNTFKADNPTLVTNIWWRTLQDDDPKEIEDAFYRYYQTNRSNFPPSAGDLHMNVAETHLPEEDTANSIIAEFEMAARNGIYGYESEFNKFTPIAQKAIGSSNTIKRWATMDDKSRQIDMAQTAKVYLKMCEQAKLDKAVNRISEGKYRELMSAPSKPMLEEKPIQKPVEPKPAVSQDEEERTLYIREDGTRITKAPKGYVEEYQRRVREHQNAERRNT